MPHINVLTDLSLDKPDIKREVLVDAEITDIGRLPGGMESGKSSIAIYAKLRESLKLEDGRTIEYVFCETSLALFQMVNQGFKGAEERAQAGGLS